MNETIRMQLSAYVDGELPESETEFLFRRLSQDAELRAEVAEFIEIGRAMRGEYTVSGIRKLRERVADALDGDATPAVAPEEPTPSKSFVKPLGGLAVAAAVALVALVGLQQTATVVEVPATTADTDPAGTEYVVPPPDPDMREYLRMHGASSSAQGANGMNVRIVSLPLGDEEVIEADPDTDEEGDAGPAAPATGTDTSTLDE